MPKLARYWRFRRFWSGKRFRENTFDSSPPNVVVITISLKIWYGSHTSLLKYDHFEAKLVVRNTIFNDAVEVVPKRIYSLIKTAGKSRRISGMSV